MRIENIDSWDREACSSWLKVYDYAKPKKDTSIEDIRELIKEVIENEIPYLLNDELFTEEANEIRKAVKLLMQITNEELILAEDTDSNVYILPAVLKDGMVEYQVSDGIDDRSMSHDFYCLEEAMEEYYRIGREGW
jgi:hypothetical protein